MKCVKGCGADVVPQQTNCPRCTWPYQLGGWHKTTYELRRITIDTCCLNVKQKDNDLNLLESWEKQGHFELQRSDALLAELRGPAYRITKAQNVAGHPPLFHMGSSFGGGVLAGPDLSDVLRQVLFPTVKNLKQKQTMDIRHLQQHIQTGGDCFVTIDKHFISRAEQLHELGIWVFRPNEMVALLRRTKRD